MKKDWVLSYSLSTQRRLCHHQTGRMPRLIRVFTGCTDQFVGFVMRRLICRVYLTNTDTAVRSRGTRLLAEILNNLPTDFLSQKEGESFCLPTPLQVGRYIIFVTVICQPFHLTVNLTLSIKISCLLSIYKLKEA